MHIGRYEVRAELGRGGMGVVYRAWHPDLEREVALKVLVLPGGMDDPELSERFATEGEAAARLSHPNTIAIHGAGVHEGRPYLVMDLIEGESLAARLERDGPLEQREAARIALGLARAILHAHERRVLHRDLKPANVLLDRRGEPVLVDFGLARLSERLGPTISGEVLGSPSWIAPEQARGNPGEVGPAADVWGIGAVLYHMLSGRPPHRGQALLATLEAALRSSPAPLDSLRSGLDPALVALVQACLARDPSHRPTASEVAAWLLRVQTRPAGRRSRRGLLLFLLPLVALVAWFAHAIHSPGDAAVPPPPTGTAPLPSAVGRRRDPCGPEHAAVAGQLEKLSQQLRSGRPREALPGYERLLIEHPRCPKVLVDASLCLLRISDPQRDTRLSERALGLLEQALELDPDDPGTWLNRAIARSQLGRHAEAVADATRAIELLPRFSGAWAQRAYDRIALGETDAALSDLDRALGAEGSHVTALIMRSELRRRRGDLEDALEDALRGLGSRPGGEREQELGQLYREAGTALLARARRRAEQGELDASRRDLDLLLERDPKQVNVRAERARVRRLLGDLAGAVEDARAVLEEEPDRVSTRLVLALSLLDLQDERAGAEFERVLDLEPDMGVAILGLAEHTARTDLAAALALAERAVLLIPGGHRPRAIRGRLRLESGDHSGAIEDFEACLAHPDAGPKDRAGYEAMLRRARSHGKH